MSIFLLILTFICLSIAVVFFMFKEGKGKKEPVNALWLAAGFGLVGSIIAALLEKKLIPIQDLKAGTPLGKMLLSFLGVGTIEETLKFLPLAIFIYPKKFFNEHIDGIIYFAIAGLGFGLPENILYTLQYGAKAGLGRLILTPIFHAAITAMVGYCLVKAKLYNKSPLTIWPVLLLAIVTHGLYDFGLSTGLAVFSTMSVCITLALSINFFNLFFRAKDRDGQLGLVAVGHNNYCRSCGSVNSSHHLYCTHCGKRA